MKLQSYLAMLLLLGFSGACQDLDVDNVTDPDRAAALAEPAAVENLIASSWISVWNVGQDQTDAASRIVGYADEGTSNHRNLEEYAQEPRQLFPNSQVGDARFLVQAPWYEIYGGAANAMDGLSALEFDGVDLPPSPGAETVEAANARARAFAWLNHGILYGYLAMIFDQASTADLTTNLADPDALAYRPYPEVQQFAMTSLQEAIDIAETGPEFETPGAWMGGNAMTNDELVRLARSYMARLMVYTPRTPEERAAIDWVTVIDHIDNGIQEDVVVQMTSGGLNSGYFQFLQQVLAQRWSADYRLIGPADVSGRYEAWVDTPRDVRERITLISPDRRVVGEDVDGDTITHEPGKYFYWTDEAIGVGESAPYLNGRYKWYRYAEGVFPWEESPNPIMTVAEMNLIKAEGLLRMDMPGAAIPLINETRVANGELPPVTVDGVPGDLSTCVPRTQTGDACGDLMTAVHYERLIEGVGIDIWYTWLNRRGFGTLQEGTFLHLPIPAQELESFRLDVYSFGGGGEWSADADEAVQ